ncbi:ionotropic receptor 21a-like [Penaeus vannamei]|uniref:ionotropic receptor 21a-like n=1 Tax=Penaeus vannamei TaxID=6689 RepID=UPI00387F76E3
MTAVQLQLIVWVVQLLTWHLASSLFLSPAFNMMSRDSQTSALTAKAINDVFETSSSGACSLIAISDGTASSDEVSMGLALSNRAEGMGVFEAEVGGSEGNVTQDLLDQIITEARKLRQESWCTNVVVLSDDPAFLASFAESSLRGRLLVWATRLLVVTRLPLQELRRLLASSWTFNMMNAMMLSIDSESEILRCSIYVHVPFSTKAKVVHVASWTASQELSLKAKTALFPEKFNNFHGGLINITALPFRPYWVEEVTEAADGTILKTYAGSDGQLMNTLAERLNFTFRVMEVKDWDEVTSKVVERKAFMSGVYHVLLPQRRKRYDFTFAYERAITEFSMAKPALRPRWQSLYYPLDENVWFCILALLALTPLFALLILVRHFGMSLRLLLIIFLCGCFFVSVIVAALFGLLIICGGKLAHKEDQADARTVTLEMVGSLLGQSIAERTGQRSGGRVMLASWLIFAFILTTAYRGNLTAALTLPKYPPRVETLPELVGVVDKITMPPYGAEFKEFFSQSDSIVFQTIAKKMQLVSNILDGLKGINEKQSHMDGERYLRLAIAEHFTLADGSNRLYVGRGSVLPTIAGLPIPHDAPYKPQVDRLLMTIIEPYVVPRDLLILSLTPDF